MSCVRIADHASEGYPADPRVVRLRPSESEQPVPSAIAAIAQRPSPEVFDHHEIGVGPHAFDEQNGRSIRRNTETRTDRAIDAGKYFAGPAGDLKEPRPSTPAPAAKLLRELPRYAIDTLLALAAWFQFHFQDDCLWFPAALGRRGKPPNGAIIADVKPRAFVLHFVQWYRSRWLTSRAAPEVILSRIVC